MSDQFPILNGRPIDKWRVTELKEELKRRKIVARGLKEELVKRLDEAIRQDMEDSEERVKDVDIDDEPVTQGDVGVEKPQLCQIPDRTIQLNENETSQWDEVAPVSDIDGDRAVNAIGEDGDVNAIGEDGDVIAIGEDGDAKLKNDQIFKDTLPLAHTGLICEDVELKPRYDEFNDDTMKLDGCVNKTCTVLKTVSVDTHEHEEESLFSSDTLVVSVEGVNQEVSVETNMIVSRNVVTPIALGKKALESNITNMDSKPTEIDAVLRVSHSHNQVYELNPNLGSEVKSESFSSDSVSLYEKNELKDNLNVNNVDVELDVFKPDIVQSSTCGGPASGGDLPPQVDQKLFDHKDSVDETEDSKSIHEGGDTANGESLEKLKYFKAATSVEEDVQDSENIDLSYSNSVEYKSGVTEVPDSNDISMGPELSPKMEETNADNKITSSASGEEVPLHGFKEPTDVDSAIKSDNIGGPILEKLNLDHCPEDDFMDEDALESKQIDSNTNPVLKECFSEKVDNDAAPPVKRKLKDEVIDETPKRQRRWNSENLKVPERLSININPCTTPKDSLQATKTENFSRPDSTVGRDAPKERIVPPSPKPPTTSLRIDHFVRPFTLKAVQELLAKTGNVCSFWMDQIKTHCYVMYSTAEEAAATRNSVYNLQWPPNGGRFLVAEFVDPHDVKMRVEPASATPPVSVVPVQQPPPSARQQNQNKQQQPPVLPPPPPMAEKLEPPIVTLDDLFKKTIATPRIYYLPLAEEQVTAKLARGNKNQGGRI